MKNCVFLPSCYICLLSPFASRLGSVTLGGKQHTVLFSKTLVPLRYSRSTQYTFGSRSKISAQNLLSYADNFGITVNKKRELYLTWYDSLFIFHCGGYAWASFLPST